LFGQTLPAARLAVMLSSLAGIAALYVIGKALGGPWTGLVAAALLAVDPLYLHASRTLQAEVPALAFALIGLAVTATPMRQTGLRRRIVLVVGGALLGLAILTKLYVAVVMVPAVLFVVMPNLMPGLRRARNQRSQRPKQRRVDQRDPAANARRVR